MGRKYFGTDGVRGKVGTAPITPDFVLRLGYAAGRTLVAHDHLPRGEHPGVLVGKDTRISGYMLEAALQAGFAAAGVDVLLCGPMPTPAVAYLTRALRLQAGVVISASHNPFDDNGIKFFSADGLKLPDAVEHEIEARLEEPVDCVDSLRLGRARRISDAPGRYIEFCKSTFPNDLDLRGLKIVVDTAHGAAYQVAPAVFHELGAETIGVGAAPNGFNINADVGATSPEALRRKVLETRADLGIALDGDGDRLVLVDAEGRSYDGDQILYILACDRQSRSPIEGVVGTLMTNLGLEHALARRGIACARAKVGDRYVLEMLQERGWTLGGENSGHVICLDRHSTGDGIIAALQVLAALRRSSLSLAQACNDLQLYPQRLINVRLAAGFAWAADPTIKAAVESAEQSLADSGRVLLRASGTEPLLRVMVEGRDAAAVDHHAEALASIVRNVSASE
jgi:phosphoglucosamine mutase